MRRNHKIAFLSMDSLEDFFAYDSLLLAPFADIGIQVDTVSWRKRDIDYKQYDAVIVRSPWDYQQHEAEFVACLQRINAQTQLINPLSLMLWNMNKQYLKSLQDVGVHTLPTLWFDDFDLTNIQSELSQFNSDEIVIKPCVSANADDTYRLTLPQLEEQSQSLKSIFSTRSFMVQPFVTSVVDHGEVSLFYFSGALSHSILKRPKAGDFRVQEEHGGSLQAITASPQMQQNAQRALAAMPDRYLYARVDLLWFEEEWRVIELELIEPSLYFTLCEQSPRRFVEAYQRYQQA